MEVENFEERLLELLSPLDDKMKASFLLILENLDCISDWIDKSNLKENELAWIQEFGLSSDDAVLKMFSAYIIAYVKTKDCELMEEKKP